MFNVQSSHSWAVSTSIGSALIWSNGLTGKNTRYRVSLVGDEADFSDTEINSLKEARYKAEDLLSGLIKRNPSRASLSPRQIIRLQTRIKNR